MNYGRELDSDVVQLAVQLLPTPEVYGSNPVLGKFYIEHLCFAKCIEETKVKKKEARNCPKETLTEIVSFI